MRKKLSLFLVMIMALTMVLGTGITAMAADGVPERVNSCHDSTDDNSLYYVTRIEGDSTVYVLPYIPSSGNSFPGASEFKAYAPFGDHAIKGRVYHYYAGKYYFCTDNLPLDPGSNAGSNPGSNGAEFEEVAAPAYVPHVHSFVYGVITEPTENADGLEGEICTGCGAVRNTQPLSAYGYVLEKYALEKINAAKPGQTITFEFGELNSFPKSFMEKLVEKSSAGVTFVFKYMVNHELQTITIPAGTPINLDFDWYGYAKMAELYGEN